MTRTLSIFDPQWDSMGPHEQWHALRTLVERGGYDSRTEEVRVWYQEPTAELLRYAAERGLVPE
jgi:hypothetical protein